jgi:hypothetical protein
VILNVAAPKDDPSNLVEPTDANSPIILPPYSLEGFLDFDPTEEEGEIAMMSEMKDEIVISDELNIGVEKLVGHRWKQGMLLLEAQWFYRE